MEVRIKSIPFDASEKLEGFINKKLEKLARRNEEITLAEVTLKVVKPETAMNKEAGVQLTIPTKTDLFASKVADTFEEAVDLVIDALERQLDKTKKDKCYYMWFLVGRVDTRPFFCLILKRTGAAACVAIMRAGEKRRYLNIF